MAANGNGQARGALAKKDAAEGKIHRPGATISALQAGLEGVPVNVEAVKFGGQLFRVADKVGLMPHLMFADAAQRGATDESQVGMAAVYAMLRDSIHADDWHRFERLAIDSKAEGPELFDVVEAVLEITTARPTQRPSDSSSPDSTSSPRSKRGSRPPGSVIPEAAAELEPVAELLLSTA
jgi:hypothetical protein